MLRKRSTALVFTMLGPIAALSGWPLAANADVTTAFTIPADDGYGLQECLSEGVECGRVLANSWCAAHGYATAVSFGRDDDTTGAIRVGAKVAESAKAETIICKN